MRYQANKVNPCFSIHLINPWITINATTKATKAPIKTGDNDSREIVFLTLTKDISVAAAITGIPKKNENDNASFLVRP